MLGFLEWLFNPPSYTPAPTAPPDDDDDLFERLDYLEAENDRLRQRMANLLTTSDFAAALAMSRT